VISVILAYAQVAVHHAIMRLGAVQRIILDEIPTCAIFFLSTAFKQIFALQRLTT
jgi:hypothetical protein